MDFFANVVYIYSRISKQPQNQEVSDGQHADGIVSQ